MTLNFPVSKLSALFARVLQSDQASEIEYELPFAVMLFTLMAASGIALYDCWKRMRKVELLPRFQKEADDVIRQVEVLGYDPLTVMYKKAEQTKSKSYRDFLAGYVSSVKSGGNVLNFLKSKLRSIFEGQSASATRAIEKLGTLVEAYAVLLIVVLCMYILYIVIASTALLELIARTTTPSSPYLTYILIFFGMPILSLMFIALTSKVRKSNLLSIDEVYKSATALIVTVLATLLAIMLTPQLNFIGQSIGWPLLVTLGLLVVSIPPAIIYHKIATVNAAAEEAMPSFIRDVTEARKIGLPPEKSIIHATKRKGYGKFTELLTLVRSQIEWGVSLRRILENIKQKIRSWPVLVHFFILVETVESGGASTTALDILSEYSEKIRDIEANKRSILKPYILLAFIWSVLIALTTTIVAMTIYILSQISLPHVPAMTFTALNEQMLVFSVGIIFQCWISGFFIGKISEGTVAAGFKYSSMLAVTAYLSLLFSQNLLWIIYGLAPPA